MATDLLSLAMPQPGGDPACWTGHTAECIWVAAKSPRVKASLSGPPANRWNEQPARARPLIQILQGAVQQADITSCHHGLNRASDDNFVAFFFSSLFTTYSHRTSRSSHYGGGIRQGFFPILGLSVPAESLTSWLPRRALQRVVYMEIASM